MDSDFSFTFNTPVRQTVQVVIRSSPKDTPSKNTPSKDERTTSRPLTRGSLSGRRPLYTSPEESSDEEIVRQPSRRKRATTKAQRRNAIQGRSSNHLTIPEDADTIVIDDDDDESVQSNSVVPRSASIHRRAENTAQPVSPSTRRSDSLPPHLSFVDNMDPQSQLRATNVKLGYIQVSKKGPVVFRISDHKGQAAESLWPLVAHRLYMNEEWRKRFFAMRTERTTNLLTCVATLSDLPRPKRSVYACEPCIAERRPCARLRMGENGVDNIIVTGLPSGLRTHTICRQAEYYVVE